MTYGSPAATYAYGEVQYPSLEGSRNSMQPAVPTAPPAAVVDQSSLIQSIQYIIQCLLCQRRDIQERSRTYKTNVALLKQNLKELEKLEEDTDKGDKGDKGTMTVHKVGRWIVDNKWWLLSSLAVVGVVGYFSCKRFSLPTIPIKIVGGGVYIQKTIMMGNYQK